MKPIKYYLYFIFVFLIWGCSSSTQINKADSIKIILRSEWNAVDPKPFQSQVPVRITIHHEGEVFNSTEDPKAFIKQVQVWGMSEARNWSDIPYHFLIDPQGNIYEGRNVYTQGETATEYNPHGHLLISCLGNYEVQEVSKKMLSSLIKLVAYCCKKYQISPETIAAHKDFANTLCPGKNLYKYIQNGYIKEEVEKLLK